MADYPSLPQGYNIDRTDLEDYVYYRADDNSVHGYSLAAQTGYELILPHPVLDATQKSTLDDFWTVNKGLLVDVTLVDTGEILSLYMTRPPKYKPIAPGYWSAEVHFIG